MDYSISGKFHTMIRARFWAGPARTEAARPLGWEWIDYVQFDGDDCEAEMWEIAENLHRADLTTAQRHAWIRRYAELMDVGNPGQNDRGLGGRGRTDNVGIATKIAEETGLSSRTIRRILAPARPAPVPPPDAPAEITPVPIQPGLVAPDVYRQIKALKTSWDDACPAARQCFLDWMTP